MKSKSFKLNSAEKKWVLYDVGNSAFTLLVCIVIPIYFNLLSEKAGLSSADHLAYWGYATSAVTIIVAVLGPIVGAMADFNGAKKKIFSVTVLLGAVGCVVLSFLQSWIWFILLFVLAKSAYSLSLVVYDAMITDVTTPERMDEVSSSGYAWGYIGSCVPFVIALVPVLLYYSDILSVYVAMPIAFAVIAVWWVAFSVPLWKNYKQVYHVEGEKNSAKSGLKNLGATFKEIFRNKKILLFLIAFFFYIDGVYTIIDMATAYGQSLGLDTVSLLIALLVTQVVAFPSAILLGRLSSKVKPEYIIAVCIVAYLGISVYALFMAKVYQFWILAVCVGMFQGTVQALSRSYFAKIIPPEKSSEFFSVYDIFGKGASFVGTTLVGLVSQLTQSQNYAVGSLSVMFLIGLVFFIFAIKVGNPRQSQSEEVQSEELIAAELGESVE